jgi:hypothetical protein
VRGHRGAFRAHGAKDDGDQPPAGFHPRHRRDSSNDYGTAPGQWIEAQGKIVALLPGPPTK